MIDQDRCRWTILDFTAYCEKSGKYENVLLCIRLHSVAGRLVWGSEEPIRSEMKAMEAEGLLDLSGHPVMTEAGRALYAELGRRIQDLPDEYPEADPKRPRFRDGDPARTFVLRPPPDDEP